MSVQVSKKKQVIFGIIVLVIILGIVEIAANVWLTTNVTCSFENNEIFQGIDENRLRQLCLESLNLRYTDEKIFPDQGEFMQINSFGFRGPEFSTDKPENTYRIFLLGGSTLIGYGVFDNETPSAYLQEMFDKSQLDFKVEIINAGNFGADSIRETNFVKTKIIRYEPDLLIIFDGWNDSASEPFDPTAWKERWIEVCQIGKQRGFDVIITIQPFVGSGNKILTEEEYKNYFTHPYLEAVKKFPQYLEKLDEINQHCAKTADLMGIFDDIRGPIFFDNVHAGPKGNQVIAENFYELSLPIILENTVKQNTTLFDGKQNLVQKEVSSIEESQLVRKSSGSFFDEIINSYKTPSLIRTFFIKFDERSLDENILSEPQQNIVPKQSANEELDFKEMNLSGLDLQNKNLQNAKFYASDLSNANLANTNLQGADLRFAKMSNVNLEKTNLEGANLFFADLSNVDLTNTNLNNVILLHTNFTNANLEGIDLSGKDLTGTILVGANLVGVNLKDVDLSGKDLTGTILEEKLFESNIEEKFEESLDLKKIEIDINKDDLVGKDLTKIDLSDVNLAGINLTNANLSGTNLLGKDLTGTILVGANLSNANLAGAVLDNSDLTKSDLTNAYLSGATFQHTKLIETNFYNADLSNTLFYNVTLENTNFENVDFSHATTFAMDFSAKSKITGAIFSTGDYLASNFDGMDLSSVVFSSDDYRSTRLAGSNFHNADLREVDLTGVDFSRKDLIQVGFITRGALLVGVDLSGKDLTSTLFSLVKIFNEKASKSEITENRKIEVDLSNANLSRTNLEGNNLSLMRFNSADLSFANLKDANFRMSDLSNTNLHGADLTNTNLKNVDLTEAILFNANLSRADLTNADLTNADLTNAVMEQVILIGTILNCFNHPICN